ncbi:MAG: hypothetical protein JNL98_07955 [Bryobacterales bacterium]|nr:hypothetical protein [Bryobacterales bacterium]
MLGVSTYSKPYITYCRRMIEAQVAAYRALPRIGPSSESDYAKFETQFIYHLILALDRCFVHRLRGKELKDGNPLNEVRMLCTSILDHGGVFTGDPTIKYNPDRSVLKLKTGEPIAVTEAQFSRLTEAFFADLEAKFC